MQALNTPLRHRGADSKIFTSTYFSLHIVGAAYWYALVGHQPNFCFTLPSLELYLKTPAHPYTIRLIVDWSLVEPIMHVHFIYPDYEFYDTHKSGVTAWHRGVKV